MSSYLNIYLVPKRKEEKEEKKYLLLMSYSRNSDIYQFFQENINPRYTGYTSLSPDNMQLIIDDLENEIESSKERLELYDKYARDNPDYIQEILSTREILNDYRSTLDTVNAIKDIVENIEDGYSDFEEVCCNIN